MNLVLCTLNSIFISNCNLRESLQDISSGSYLLILYRNNIMIIIKFKTGTDDNIT